MKMKDNQVLANTVVSDNFVEVKNLKKYFSAGMKGTTRQYVKAVDDVS